jgi:hypothetical protein
MAKTLLEGKTVEARVRELIAAIQSLRPDFLVQLVPKYGKALAGAVPAYQAPTRHVPVLSGKPTPEMAPRAEPNLEVVLFYSRGRAIETNKDGLRPALISTHPMFNRIAHAGLH